MNSIRESDPAANGRGDLRHVNEDEIRRTLNAPGKAMAHCPGHADTKPSLRIGTGAQGQTLLHCFGGCPPEHVCAKMGLRISQLCVPRNGHQDRNGHAATHAKVKKREPTGSYYETRKAAVRACDRRLAERGFERVGRWVYQDAASEVFGLALRYQDKSGSKQFRPVTRWPEGIRLCGPPEPWPAYNLPKLLAAEKAKTVYVLEGEKCADLATELGLVATTSQGGAANAKGTDWTPLAGRDVVIVPDFDDAGAKYAAQVRDILVALDPPAKVRILDLDFPGRKQGDDLVEFVAHHRDNGQTDKQIRNKVLTAAWAEEPVPPKGTDDGPPRKESIATRLVRIAQEALDLFHTPDGQGYGRTKVAPHQVWALRSRPARQHLAQLFYKAEHIAPAAEAMSTALSTLEGIAVHDGQEHPVFTRMGHAPDGAIYLDLGDPTWRAVAVRRDGWQIVADCPVMFRRSRGLLALPEPVRGGSVHQLRELYNVGSDNDWQLIVGWMLGAFRPKGPYPVLVLAGEQGSAKSSAAELARDTIDPNTASLRSEPRDPRDLMIAATNSWVIAYDNLSHLPPWLSDCLCRLATGGGFATRELYSDGDETIFSATRPALVNGIEDIVTRADLLDRSMLVSLPTIPEHARRTKSSIDGAFKAMHAQVLGALLDAVCTGLTNIDKVKLRNLPRMADFARWVTACSSALGWEKTAFVDAYRENIRAANDLALGESAIVGPLRKLIERHTTWSGTPGDLLVALTKLVDEKLASSRDWPKRPNELGGRLKRLAPNLRKAGVHIDFKRSGLARLIELSEYKLPQRSATPAPK